MGVALRLPPRQSPACYTRTHTHTRQKPFDTLRGTLGASVGAPAVALAVLAPVASLLSSLASKPSGLPRVRRLQGRWARGRGTAWQALWQPAASEPPVSLPVSLPGPHLPFLSGTGLAAYQSLSSLEPPVRPDEH